MRLEPEGVAVAGAGRGETLVAQVELVADATPHAGAANRLQVAVLAHDARVRRDAARCRCRCRRRRRRHAQVAERAQRRRRRRGDWRQRVHAVPVATG